MQRLTRKLAVREIPFEDARLDGTQPLQTHLFLETCSSCIDLDSVKTEFVTTRDLFIFTKLESIFLDFSRPSCKSGRSESKVWRYLFFFSLSRKIANTYFYVLFSVILKIKEQVKVELNFTTRERYMLIFVRT